MHYYCKPVTTVNNALNPYTALLSTQSVYRTTVDSTRIPHYFRLTPFPSNKSITAASLRRHQFESAKATVCVAVSEHWDLGTEDDELGGGLHSTS